MESVEKLIGLPEFKALRINTRYKQKVIIDIETKTEKLECPKCKQFTSSIDHRYWKSRPGSFCVLFEWISHLCPVFRFLL